MKKPNLNHYKIINKFSIFFLSEDTKTMGEEDDDDEMLDLAVLMSSLYSRIQSHHTVEP